MYGLSQRLQRRELRRRNQVRRRSRRDDDRPRAKPCLSAEAAAARRASGAASRSRGTSPGRTGCTTFPSMRARARLSVSAASTGRASANCSLRCSACCAEFRAKCASPGQSVSASSPRAAKSPAVAMALIPEDRKTEGLMLPMSVCANLSFAAFDRVSRGGIIDRVREEQLVAEMINLLAIRAASPESRRARCRAETSRRWSSPNG